MDIQEYQAAKVIAILFQRRWSGRRKEQCIPWGRGGLTTGILCGSSKVLALMHRMKTAVILNWGGGNSFNDNHDEGLISPVWAVLTTCQYL